MTSEPVRIEFNGVLGRREYSPDLASLHFYPYGMSVDGDLKSVLVVELRLPCFEKHTLDVLDGSEVSEIEIGSQTLVYSHGYGDRSVQLKASSAASYWRAYDIEDLRQRVCQLEKCLSETSEKCAKAERLISNGVSLANELIRRAEMKSAGSQSSIQKHNEAVAVLRRIVRHFDSAATNDYQT